MSSQQVRNKIIQDIQDEVKLYCQMGVWSKTWIEVQCWLSNFKGNEEHYYFAHLLLDKIVFRTNEMLACAYRRFLATIVRQKVNELSPISYSVPDFFRALKQPDNNLIHHFRVTAVLTNEKAESGSALLRHLNSELINPQFNLQNEENRKPSQVLEADYETTKTL